MTVTFKANMGLVQDEYSTRFEPEHVEPGDTGEYIGPHPDSGLREKGWHMVRVAADGRELLCPCHESQFEEAS